MKKDYVLTKYFEINYNLNNQKFYDKNFIFVDNLQFYFLNYATTYHFCKLHKKKKKTKIV